MLLTAAAAVGVTGLEAGCSRLPAGAPWTTVHGLLTHPPYTIAHRGGSLDWPEMSEYGYEQSVAHHAGALEISVARTVDGVWFGLHDQTLDRTSGTTGAVAARMTWSAVSRYRISADETRFPGQPARPYYRLDDFLRRFPARRIVFLDPKAAAPRFYAELLAMVHRLVPTATTRVVAKSDATDTVWASMASRAGFRTWGFYYGSDLIAQPGLLAATERSWDLLGLDWEASPATWRQVTALGKKVVGHVIDTVAERDEVLARGATGLMVADVLRVGP